jgi:hypothetical protein
LWLVVGVVVVYLVHIQVALEEELEDLELELVFRYLPERITPLRLAEAELLAQVLHRLPHKAVMGKILYLAR